MSDKDELHELAARLGALLDTDPTEAVREARQLGLSRPNSLNVKAVRAAFLVDGGVAARQQDAVEEGLQLLRELHATRPDPSYAYNIANALISLAGRPPNDATWLDHQERTREQRAEARRLYWRVSREVGAPADIQTQAWTNLANQLTSSYRLGEAHDARLKALEIDPTNGVAAGTAARDLLWLFEQGHCSDVTRVEAVMLAKLAKRHVDRVLEYAGQRAASEFAALADQLA